MIIDNATENVQIFRLATRVFLDVVPTSQEDDDMSFKQPCKIIIVDREDMIIGGGG